VEGRRPLRVCGRQKRAPFRRESGEAAREFADGSARLRNSSFGVGRRHLLGGGRGGIDRAYDDAGDVAAHGVVIEGFGANKAGQQIVAEGVELTFGDQRVQVGAERQVAALMGLYAHLDWRGRARIVGLMGTH